MKHFSKQAGFEIKRFGAHIAVASDLWYLTVSNKLPSKTHRVYQVFGVAFKSYDEMFILSFYLVFFKFTLGWFRK